MKALYTSFRSLSIVYVFFNYVWSSPTPMLFANDDLYEVGDGENVVEHRVDNEGVPWKQQADLHRLEVLSNDLVTGLPFKSCIEEKLTRQIKYGDYAGKNSKFEEIHQVMFSILTFVTQGGVIKSGS